jgi:hypothetical protein
MFCLEKERVDLQEIASISFQDLLFKETLAFNRNLFLSVRFFQFRSPLSPVRLGFFACPPDS